MASRHTWEAADAGVMLWQPATETALDLIPEEPQEPWETLKEEDIQDSLGGSHDDEEEVILPSIEKFSSGTHVKDELVQHLYTLRSSSPSTACADKGSHMQDASSSTIRARSVSSSTFSNLLSGIELYGQSESPVRPTDGQDITGSPQSPSNSASSGSDWADYEFVASSPCPNRGLTSQLLETPIANPLQKPLDSGMATSRETTDTVPQAVDSCGRAALIALRGLERDPPHHWDEDERELLVILHRWYEDATPTSISQVFNAVTGLQLSPRIVRNQFNNYILLYGGRAFPEYQRVMAVPFSDPKVYNEIRDIIDNTAIEFGINLPRRRVEVIFESGQARSAKSPKTRKHYRNLVRRAAEKEREKLRVLRQPQSMEPEPEPEPEKPLRACLIGRTTLAPNPEWEVEDIFFDVEEPLASRSILPRTSLIVPHGTPSRPHPSTRHIGFRVWDGDSRTMFTEEDGFVSEAFARFWSGDYPPPFSPEEAQGLQALKILTNLHLSLSGGASTFVSVSTSLLQALVKASNMKEPIIAIKRMVWADVQADAILSHFPLADLQSLSNQDQTCSEILSLQCIQPGKRTSSVSSKMRAQNKMLNTTTAKAMAAVCRTFGMHRKNVSLAHVQGLVASLVDSFSVQANSATDIHTTSSIASAFALALRSRVHLYQQVMQAFQDGIGQGMESVEYYSGRGRRGAAGM
ncbi:conserved hypothetical protein [Pyrenophora tritici-repentis Pt-1C-BFP]|uniref:DUF7587 domain-containing protein n=1 Tax=Pyrenophora tritici-repentis (strain Pt-1C-BFP) TaxID=426418 RepID=B2WB05_PYRTR|nr:uncharacterized protein PTRG_07468 [Pyrenophora tritici-repentis Pt-1C-BFP]EDU50387.1 conserved hypothetical protein [Pyrenophora tritici-repentis Pt-1C-BFP]